MFDELEDEEEESHSSSTIVASITLSAAVVCSCSQEHACYTEMHVLPRIQPFSLRGIRHDWCGSCVLGKRNVKAAVATCNLDGSKGEHALNALGY